jgi:N-formylglutamate amidohydrolase
VSDSFELREGPLPLLVSVPHDGRLLAEDMEERMTGRGRAIPDTDWHVNRLYEFAGDLGANVLSAKYSRYVADLNRSPADAALYPGQVDTGLCPEKTFAGEPIYRAGCALSGEEKARRIEKYWQPYHEQLQRMLDRIRSAHGFAVLWDAHSIRGEVPLLFDGTLPELNIGTNDGRSCSPEVEQAVADVAARSAYSHVVNGRFRGGYITRTYGSPGDDIHAVQLELVQACYMDESSRLYDVGRAARLTATIKGMVEAALANVTYRR